eukprot:TRINITY_DN5384_c0_g1_i1.p2 TRINITY_DN5384_c0_g1~~TRINITY_DN5384_c0_g1_i1.p2  ORF type:complete len:194 (+),score=48.97 TRINITY_DN5384_c0_g1_i1:126-707(+)
MPQPAAEETPLQPAVEPCAVRPAGDGELEGLCRDVLRCLQAQKDAGVEPLGPPRAAPQVSADAPPVPDTLEGCLDQFDDLIDELCGDDPAAPPATEGAAAAADAAPAGPVGASERELQGLMATALQQLREADRSACGARAPRNWRQLAPPSGRGVALELDLTDAAGDDPALSAALDALDSLPALPARGPGAQP